MEKSFDSEICFPSIHRTEGYLKIEPYLDKEIIEDYKIKVIGNEVFITEKVQNLLFKKKI